MKSVTLTATVTADDDVVVVQPTQPVQPLVELETEMPSNALKAVGETANELRVANYMVLFGGRDLEGLMSRRRNPDGSRGEYFTKATKFDSAYTELDMVVVDWQHGLRQDADLSQHDLLGRVDWKTARIDEMGLFVERVLNRRDRYVRALERLIRAGLVGTSSDAVTEKVTREPDGRITKWPIKRDTLTVSPMDPRMLNANVLVAVKAAIAEIPSLESLFSLSADSIEALPPQADSKSAENAVEESEERKRIINAQLMLHELDRLELL